MRVSSQLNEEECAGTKYVSPRLHRQLCGACAPVSPLEQKTASTSDDGTQKLLVASDAGYGFIGTLGDMTTKNKAGKTLLSVPKGALALPPVPINNIEETLVAAFSSEGRLLVFPLADLPTLGRGKGIKVINIPSARVIDRSEIMQYLVVLGPEESIVVLSGKRTLNLKPSDLAHYRGERARRGLKLPRGFQKVDRLTVE